MDNKDLTLKFLCKILYNAMGYCTHYEVKLRNKSYITNYKTYDISDIDVFGYTFNADLSYYTIGAECKSGETNAIDEFYKFLGISDFYKLNRSYLIKTKIHQNARQLALSKGFICLSEAEIRKMLLGFEINVDKLVKYESANYAKSLKAFTLFKNRSPKLVEYIELDFWNRDNWKNIHNLQHIVKQISSHPGRYDNVDVKDKYVFYYLCELFAYTILKASSEAITLNFADFDNAFVSVLYGGSESLNERRRIQDTVNIATQRNDNFEPEWQADLVNICARMSQSTLAAAAVPNLIQDICDNCIFEKIAIEQSVIQKYHDLTRKFTQDIMQFFIRSCDVNPQVYEDFMAL